MAKKYCYLFSEGNANMREILGGKGANLAEMTNIGLPVPQGFTISTEACTQYYEDGRQINDGIIRLVCATALLGYHASQISLGQYTQWVSAH